MPILGRWKPRVIDWTKVAKELGAVFEACAPDDIEMDGRLWALLHRVKYISTHENPVAGVRQVEIGMGDQYQLVKYFDLPIMINSLNMMWKIVDRHGMLIVTEYDRGGVSGVRITVNVHIAGTHLGLCIARFICRQISQDLPYFKYDLPEEQHVRKRIRPREMLLEAWPNKLHAEKLRNMAGDGSKPKLKGNTNGFKKRKINNEEAY